MKDINWSIVKSERLKRTRGISFEDIISSKLIMIKKHPTRKQQDIMLFEYKKYIWVVPYVENANEIFLKTLFPSRKYTKLYREDKLE